MSSSRELTAIDRLLESLEEFRNVHFHTLFPSGVLTNPSRLNEDALLAHRHKSIQELGSVGWRMHELLDEVLLEVPRHLQGHALRLADAISLWEMDGLRRLGDGTRPIELRQNLAESQEWSRKKDEFEARLYNLRAVVNRRTPPPDGPRNPNRFYYGGRSAELEPIPFRLLRRVWNEPEGVPVDDLVEQVWGGSASDAAMQSAKAKVNGAIASIDAPFQLHARNGRFFLDGGE